jgi:hypothetical protein
MGDTSAFRAYLKRINKQWQAETEKLVLQEDPRALRFVQFGMNSSYDALKGFFTPE